MTFLTELNSVIVIMAILYWSISKELGVYLFMGWGGNRLANGFLKVTACAYRPWIMGSADPAVRGLTLRIMGWVASNPEKDWIVLCAGIGLATAIALYAAFKPFPADFDAQGKLIVDGAKMANDTFKGVGYSLAVLIGWILERRIVGFSTEIPVAQRLSRAFVGLISCYAVSLMLVSLIKAWIPGATGAMLSCFLQVFYVMFLFPWCFHLAEKSTRSQRQPE